MVRAVLRHARHVCQEHAQPHHMVKRGPCLIQYHAQVPEHQAGLRREVALMRKLSVLREAHLTGDEDDRPATFQQSEVMSRIRVGVCGAGYQPAASGLMT